MRCTNGSSAVAPTWKAALDQARSHRIEHHITRGGAPMRQTERARSETPLKQIPARSRATVDVQRITPVRLADGARQPVGGFGHRQQMNVIGQQAVTQNAHLELFGLFTHQAQVKRAVGIAEEHVAPPHAALHDVVSVTGQNNARKTRHNAQFTLRRVAELGNVSPELRKVIAF